MTLGRRGPLCIGRRNALLDLLRGLDDVRRAVFALLFERDYVGRLRGAVLANAIAVLLLVAVGWLWLLPAVEHVSDPGGHLWLLAIGLTIGPAWLDLLAGWAQDPIRRATEQHMLGATPTAPPRTGPSWTERLQVLTATTVSFPLAMALISVPAVGLVLTILFGAALAAIVWLQPPLAVRGFALPQRLRMIRRNPWRALGTGLGLQLAAGVPFLNLLGLAPIATIAGSSAYLHFDKGAPAYGRPTADHDPSSG